jgi:hypothetical protein
MATITAHPTTTDSGTGIAGWPVWRVGLVFGVLAAVAATLVAAIAQGVGVPMLVGQAGQDPIVVPLEAYAISTIPSVILGTAFAIALARWSRRPVAWFVGVTVVLTLLSFGLPHTTQYATIATRLSLDLTHIAAALTFIPVMAWRLSKVAARS